MRKLGEHLRNQWAGFTALFLVLCGGTAWAVDGPLAGQNTIGSEDIIGNEVKSDDIGNGRIFNLDIADEIITGQKLKDESVTGDDIDDKSLTDDDIDSDNGLIASANGNDVEMDWTGFEIRTSATDELKASYKKYIKLDEYPIIGQPAADNGWLYVRDNGSGVTQLAVMFPSGDIDVLASDDP